MNEQMFEQHPNYNGYRLSQADFMNPHGAISTNAHEDLCFIDKSKAEAVCMSVDSTGDIVEEHRAEHEYPVTAFGNALSLENGVIVNWGGPFLSAPCMIERLDPQLQTRSWVYQVDMCENEYARPFLGYSRVVPPGIEF